MCGLWWQAGWSRGDAGYFDLGRDPYFCVKKTTAGETPTNTRIDGQTDTPTDRRTDKAVLVMIVGYTTFSVCADSELKQHNLIDLLKLIVVTDPFFFFIFIKSWIRTKSTAFVHGTNHTQKKGHDCSGYSCLIPASCIFSCLCPRCGGLSGLCVRGDLECVNGATTVSFLWWAFNNTQKHRVRNGTLRDFKGLQGK